mgnify:CR=1 FL=1
MIELDDFMNAILQNNNKNAAFLEKEDYGF